MILALTGIDVAFASVIVAAVVGSGGLLSAFWLAPAARKHERELARDARLHDELRSAYGEYLENVYALQEACHKTTPRPKADATELPEEIRQFLQPELIAQWWHAGARTSVIASEEVAAKMNEASDRFGDYWGALGTVEGTPDDQRDTTELEASKAAFDASVDALEKLMRADVRK